MPDSDASRRIITVIAVRLRLIRLTIGCFPRWSGAVTARVHRYLLSCDSPRPPHQQGMSLHAQIPFPAAFLRTAAVAADRYDDAHEHIHEPAWDSVHRAVAAGACVFGRGVASVVRATPSGCGGRVHEWGLVKKAPASATQTLCAAQRTAWSGQEERFGC